MCADVAGAVEASAAGFADDDVAERSPSADETPPGDADITRPRPYQTPLQSGSPAGAQTPSEIHFRHFRSCSGHRGIGPSSHRQHQIRPVGG